MSSVISRFRHYWSHFWSSEERPEGGVGYRRSGFLGDNSRKRVASNVFEPEITDDEDDPPSGYLTYQPFKRLRSDPGFEMSSHNKQPRYVTRGSGISPRIEGLRHQPWEYVFKDTINKGQPSLDPPVKGSALGHGSRRGGNNEPRAGTSRNAKAIEVVTLDEEVGAETTSTNETGTSNALALILKPKLSTQMKQKPRDGNRISTCLANIGKKVTRQFSNSNSTRWKDSKEMQKYRDLLKFYRITDSSGNYEHRNQPLTKKKLNQEELKALYECGPNTRESYGSVVFQRKAEAFPVSNDTTISRFSIPTLTPLPRLYSTPAGHDFSSSSKRRSLAIQPTPELIDLESDNASHTNPVGKELSPIKPSGSTSSILQSSSPIKGPLAGNYTNLEDALNNSLFELPGSSLPDDEQAPLAIEGVTGSQIGSDEGDKEDISIIAERVVNASRRKSVNSLALEQTSSPYVERKWLNDSKITFRDNQSYRADRIREEEATLAILHRDSRLEKDLEERIRRKLTLTEHIVLDEPPPTYPELTDDMIIAIQNAKTPGRDNTILAQVSLLNDTIEITKGDVRTLCPGQWLNDNIINTYIGLIVKRSREVGSFPSVYAFQTFFYPKLLKEGYSNSLKRWTRKDDIFAFDLLILPIHLGMHWCLACVDFRSKSIRYFDSLGGDNNKCLTSIQDYLCREMKERKKIDLNKSEWTLENVKNIPLQRNGSDCGMFSCKFAEYLSRDAAFTFGQEQMPYFRDRMIIELLRQDLKFP